MFALLALGPDMALQGAAPELPQPQCAIAFATRFADRLSDLPKQIQDDLLKEGKVAEASEPFNNYDVTDDIDRPWRRFVRAGQSGSKWFVWLEHGGIQPHYDVFGYGQLWESTDKFTWHRGAQLQGEPCIAINAFFSGVWTSGNGH